MTAPRSYKMTGLVLMTLATLLFYQNCGTEFRSTLLPAEIPSSDATTQEDENEASSSPNEDNLENKLTINDFDCSQEPAMPPEGDIQGTFSLFPNGIVCSGPQAPLTIVEQLVSMIISDGATDMTCGYFNSTDFSTGNILCQPSSIEAVYIFTSPLFLRQAYSDFKYSFKLANQARCLSFTEYSESTVNQGNGNLVARKSALIVCDVSEAQSNTLLDDIRQEFLQFTGSTQQPAIGAPWVFENLDMVCDFEDNQLGFGIEPPANTNRQYISCSGTIVKRR